MTLGHWIWLAVRVPSFIAIGVMFAFVDSKSEFALVGVVSGLVAVGNAAIAQRGPG